MSEPPKLKILAWRFFFWITPRWLSRKYRAYMLRRIVERYPAYVDRKLRESANAMKQHLGETSPSEEVLVALHKRGLDRMLHPQAARDALYRSGIRGRHF